MPRPRRGLSRLIARGVRAPSRRIVQTACPSSPLAEGFSENLMSTASHALSVKKESKVKSVFRVVSGNFLEMYDFMVYGYYASAIAFLGVAAMCGLIATLVLYRTQESRNQYRAA
jgi:hypothetical protein